MFARNKFVLICVLAVGVTATLGSRYAHAQIAPKIIGELPLGGPNGYDGATIIVTGVPTISADLCGVGGTGVAYQVVIVQPPTIDPCPCPPGNDPAIVTTLVVSTTVADVLSPGDRFTTGFATEFCFDTTTGNPIGTGLFRFAPVVTGGGLLAVVSAPTSVALDLDDEAVVKGQSDADGNTNVVVVRHGPPIHTQVWSDLPLEPADRIVDFLLLWDEPATGQTIYMAVVEW